jgi:hypothetical protein
MSKIILIVVVALAVVGAGMFFSYRNTEVALRNRFEASVDGVEASHDAMWKILQQKAGVTSQYKDAFEKIYPEIIAGRYQGQQDGSLMKMVTEANPEFNISLYQDLMQAIEAQRTAFLHKQEAVLDVQREYNTYIEQMPNSIFMPATATKLKYTVISSGRSKAARETGIDDDVDLFDKAPAATAPAATPAKG